MHHSVVLASNIHCATCVNHIRVALERKGSVVQEVSVRLNTISIKHQQQIKTGTLIQIIGDEGFNVYSARTVDSQDRVVFNETLDSSVDAWFDEEARRWVPKPIQRKLSDWFTSKAPRQTQQNGVSNEEKRKRHIENCETCCATQVVGNRPNDSITPPAATAMEVAETSGADDDTRTKAQEQSKRLGQGGDANTQTWKVTLSLGGMTCASCSNAITEAVQSMGPVTKVQIDLMMNNGVVTYAGPKGYTQQIVNEIEDIGYSASVVEQVPIDSQESHCKETKQTDVHANLSITGMTCAACSNAINNGLDELPFVKRKSINFLMNSGEVVVEDKSNIDYVLAKIEELGYGATVEEISTASEVGENSNAEKPRSRTVQIQVDGMFCDNCPSRITTALKDRFGSYVNVEKLPTLKVPILTIVYEPQLPDRSIRDIVSVIQNIQQRFEVKIYHPPSIEERSKLVQIRERNRILWRLLLAFIVVIPTFIIGIVFMDLLPDSNHLAQFFTAPAWAGNVKRGDWVMFILATPVYFFAADIFHVHALKEIYAIWRKGSRVPMLRRFYRFGSMNLLICAGTSVAYLSSVIVLIMESISHNNSMTNSSYFDSVVFLTFFILVGRYLEAFSKMKTSDAVSMLGQLRPAEAMLVAPSSRTASVSSDSKQPNKTRTIAADLLEIGDCVIVAHGSSPPSDGVIIVGNSKFDESSLSGESRPTPKSVGERVFAGTINNGDPVTIQITDIGGGSMLDEIVNVVREGMSKRASIERLADVLTGYFVPIITGLAIATFVIWAALGYSGAISSRYVDGRAGGWAFYSLGFAVSVFVAACPCGIGLAAPTALFVGIGLAAKHGILVRGGGEAFQEAPYIDAVVFDKTGTLTEGGDLEVTNHETIGDADPDLIAALATRLEEHSTHPIAQAIVTFFSSNPRVSLEEKEIVEEPGLGLRGTFDHDNSLYEAAIGSPAFVGSLASNLLEPHSIAATTIATWQSESQSVAVLVMRMRGQAWRLAALFGTSDPIRPSAAQTVATLQRQGIAVYMLSGDNPTTARTVGASIGIPTDHIFAGVLPIEKAERIRALQRDVTPISHRSLFGRLSAITGARMGTQHARIAFVGDGINDAPALTASDLSISLSSGSPIALTASSFVLLSPSLMRIPLLLDLSRRVMRRVTLNFGWACIYNIILIPVAAGVLFKAKPDGWMLGPVWAALAMAGSSVSVVVSSLALRWERFKEADENDD